MNKDEEQERIFKIKDHLQRQTSLRKKSRAPNRSFLKKKGITFAEPQNDEVKEADTHDIYHTYNQTPEEVQSESSFELDDEENVNKQLGQKQTIQKVLARLGLNKKATKNDNEELEMVVNNIIENCIGTVNTQENLQTYQSAYGQLYTEKVKKKTSKGSIIVSELKDIQKIQKLPDHKLWGVYKYIRLMMKKLSLLCECIVQHPIFESFILIVIILNSVKMAFDDPLSTTSGNPTIENIFIVLYTMEMSIKIIAFGFVLTPGSYLRDPWNIMDFVIVSTSLMPLVININFSVNSLRAIRVLRPLKTITKVKSLKMIVSTLFFSFSLVMDSLYILIFVMIVFSIAGTQLFSGLLQNRCMDILTGTMTDALCSTGSTCDGGLVCAKGIESPNFSIYNFDTFIWSMLSVFQTLTMEGWSDIMINLQQAYSAYAFIYSVMIVFFCEYVLLNMTLAILKYKYSQVKGNAIEDEEEEINEYEPEFLKKIGIYNKVSKLVSEPPLTRYLCDSKNFVGSRQFYDDSSDKKDYRSYDLTLSGLEAKNDKRKTTTLKNDGFKIDIGQLKNLGRTQEQKWDAKTLEFEMMGFEDKEDLKFKESDKNIKEEAEEEEDILSEINSDQTSEEDDEDEESQNSDSEISFKSRNEIADKIINVQKKLRGSSTNIQNPTGKSIRSHKILNEVPVQNKVVIENQEVQELDNMLKLISETPGSSLTNNKYMIHLPDVDLEQMEVDRLYARFNDLGEYRIRRVEKNNALHYVQIKNSKNRNIPEMIKKKQQNNIQEMREEAELDLKELQLVNQLSKKELKCRIKPKQVLNEQRLASSYDITRVIVSQKLKEIEMREEEIRQSTNNLNFHVTYRRSQTQKISKQVLKNSEELMSIFRRNLNNDIVGLKLPEMIHGGNVKKVKAKTASTIKNEANNTYLRLLQNHQMEEKIQLREDRILHIFFKKQLPTRKDRQQAENQNEQQKLSLIEQYKKIREDDIFVRHGRIHLNQPYQSLSDSPQSLLQKINIKPQEYEIYMKGLFGIINVMRKKVLLFVSRPLYDNSMLVIVLINTVIMAMNGLVNTDQSPYSDMNTIFTYVFAADLFLKIFAYGIGFFTDIMNLFDSFVVGISIVQLSFGSGGSNLSALRAVRILRAFRVLRITRLIRSLSYMRIVMSVVSSIITEFVYIFMLLSLFMFIYTLLGMQIFGGQFLPESVTGIRQSFDTFFDAFFTVFQVLTVENWNDIETLVLTSQTGTWSIVYLISWIFIGNWILLNLLQAILLDGFDEDSDIFSKPSEENEEQAEPPIQLEEENAEEETQTDNVSISSAITKQKVKTTDASLFIFLPDNIIREIAIKISNSSIFQNIIIIMIALSSIKLVVDTYIQPGSKIEQIASILDYVFNFIFIFESALKIIAQGLIIGQKAYLKSSWSKLDFFIVSTAIVDMLLDVNLSILKLFRTLRPLRIISRNPDMRVIISSLGESMMGILNVLIIIMCIFLMIGILGINLLGDKLNYCNPTHELSHANYGPYNINQTTCQSAGGVWTTQLINFDNIGNSFLSLYVFSTRQNWPFYSLTLMDASDNGPVKNNSQIVFLIFSIVIIFVCSYFFMDLLVGVLFMNFHKAEQKIRPKTLTDKQINWKNLQKIIIQEDPCFDLYLQPSNKFSQFFYSIVHLKAFDIFVTLCIIGNILIMMVATNDQTNAKSVILDRINFAFSIVFMIEAFFKLCTFGKAYFLSGWNIFDFFVVMASVLDIILSYSGAKNQNSSALSILPQIARIFRVMRVTKLLRMFKRFKGLQKLIETFIFSLPALAKGLSIVCLFLFIFSVLASFLFNNISGDYTGIINEYKNFQNFHASFETLFIMTTGENWYFYMYESIYDGYVTCDDGIDCTHWYYLLFWLVYVFFSQKVFMELFVLIVLDQFEANYINENNPLGIFALLEDDFRTKWIEMTTKYHSEKIEAKRLLDFLLILRQPLGMGKNQLMIKYEEELRENQKITEEQVKQSLNELDIKLKKNGAKLINKIPIIKNRMYLGYHETFYHFAKLSIAGQFLDSSTPNQKIELDEMHKISEEALEKLKPEGNLYFYQEDGNQNTEKNEVLNPIELILFCQMIVKSWHNYSLKYHTQKKEKKIKNQDNSLYNSLNNSCASDIEEAKLEKLDNQKKFVPRRGLMEKRESSQMKRLRPEIPNVDDHYKNDRKKGKFKQTKKKTSVQRNASKDLTFLKQKIEIRITQNQD